MLWLLPTGMTTTMAVGHPPRSKWCIARSEAYHIVGILGLLNSSFQTAIEDHPYIHSLLYAINDKIDKLEELNTNVSGLQCPIFKYSSYSATPSSVFSETVAGATPDQNRPGDVPRADLLTTVYVPYMAGEREVMGNGVKTKKAKKIIADESSVGGVKLSLIHI